MEIWRSELKNNSNLIIYSHAKIIRCYCLLTVCSWTAHLGGKITKSAIAVPGKADFDVRTVNMDGSFSINGAQNKYISIKKRHIPSGIRSY
jgi:hypothetical protein